MSARGSIFVSVSLGLVLTLGFVSWRADSAQNEPSGRKLAFLVGVNQYRHAKLDKLEFAEQDVNEMRSLLREQGYAVVLLKGEEASKQQIDSRLKTLLNDVSSRDLILIGLAGHGLQPDGSNEAYFCPYDANATIEAGKGTEPSHAQFPEKLLKITGSDGLIAQVDNSGAGKKLFFIDACRNDSTSGRGRGVAATIQAVPEQTWVLLSCARKERAFETKKLGGGHGVFFYHVLEGLRGKAADERGIVKWSRLAEYVSERVPEVVPSVIGGGAEQHPNELKNGSEIVALASITARPKPLDKPMLKLSEPTSEPTGFAGTRAGQVRDLGGLKLVWIPPGEFTMGSPVDEKDRSDDENLVQVTLTKGFWLGQHEVTQGEWQRVMQTTPWSGKENLKEGDNYPAMHVSWEGAARFCEKLTESERSAGRLPNDWEYSLPTEAQWEYSCRGGTKSPFSCPRTFPDLSDHGWWGGIGEGSWASAAKEPYVHTVGAKKANPWGLYDMHGNVWEWCRDWYAKELLGGTDPQGPSEGLGRVNRGGSWNSEFGLCRSAKRRRNSPDFRDFSLGFRLAVVPSGKLTGS
jgi:formylglycine-generating enzyme